MNKGPLVVKGIWGMKSYPVINEDYFINHYKDPYQTTRIQSKVSRFFSVAQVFPVGCSSNLRAKTPNPKMGTGNPEKSGVFLKEITSL